MGRKRGTSEKRAVLVHWMFCSSGRLLRKLQVTERNYAGSLTTPCFLEKGKHLVDRGAEI